MVCNRSDTLSVSQYLQQPYESPHVVAQTTDFLLQGTAVSNAAEVLWLSGGVCLANVMLTGPQMYSHGLVTELIFRKLRLDSLSWILLLL